MSPWAQIMMEGQGGIKTHRSQGLGGVGIQVDLLMAGLVGGLFGIQVDLLMEGLVGCLLGCKALKYLTRNVKFQIVRAIKVDS